MRHGLINLQIDLDKYNKSIGDSLTYKEHTVQYGFNRIHGVNAICSYPDEHRSEKEAIVISNQSLQSNFLICL